MLGSTWKGNSCLDPNKPPCPVTWVSLDTVAGTYEIKGNTISLFLPRARQKPDTVLLTGNFPTTIDDTWAGPDWLQYVAGPPSWNVQPRLLLRPAPQ